MRECMGYITLYWGQSKKEEAHFCNTEQRKRILHKWKQMYGLNDGCFSLKIKHTLVTASNEELELMRRLNQIPELELTNVKELV